MEKLQQRDAEKPIYKTEILAPTLEKKGLKIHLPLNSHLTIQDLLNDGVISPEIVAEHGFVIIENYPECQEADETIIAKDDAVFPHRDMDGNQGWVVLRYPDQPNPRQARTIVGSTNEVFKKMTEALRNIDEIIVGGEGEYRTNELRRNEELIAALQKDIANRVEAISEGEAFDPLEIKKERQGANGNTYSILWKLDIFDGSNGPKINPKSPTAQWLQEDVLSPYFYSHTWEPHQIMIIDDSSMVHGRVPFKWPEGPGGYLTFRAVKIEGKTISPFPYL